MLARARIIQVMFSGFLVSQKKTFFMDFYKINLIWIFGKQIHIQQLSIKLVRITAHLITEFRTLKKNIVFFIKFSNGVILYMVSEEKIKITTEYRRWPQMMTIKVIVIIWGQSSACIPFDQWPSWSWSYGSWIYNYLCNQCLSLPKFWVRILLMARCTWYNIMW